MDRSEKDFEKWLESATLTEDRLEEYHKVDPEFDTAIVDSSN